MKKAFLSLMVLLSSSMALAASETVKVCNPTFALQSISITIDGARAKLVATSPGGSEKSEMTITNKKVVSAEALKGLAEQSGIEGNLISGTLYNFNNGPISFIIATDKNSVKYIIQAGQGQVSLLGSTAARCRHIDENGKVIDG